MSRIDKIVKNVFLKGSMGFLEKGISLGRRRA
jgi:hypothetical protein